MAGDDIAVEVKPEAAASDIEVGKSNAEAGSTAGVSSEVGVTTNSKVETSNAAAAATDGSVAQPQREVQAQAPAQPLLQPGAVAGTGEGAGVGAKPEAVKGGAEDETKGEGEDGKEEAQETAVRRSSLAIRLLQAIFTLVSFVLFLVNEEKLMSISAYTFASVMPIIAFSFSLLVALLLLASMVSLDLAMKLPRITAPLRLFDLVFCILLFSSSAAVSADLTLLCNYVIFQPNFTPTTTECSQARIASAFSFSAALLYLVSLRVNPSTTRGGGRRGAVGRGVGTAVVARRVMRRRMRRNMMRAAM